MLRHFIEINHLIRKTQCQNKRFIQLVKSGGSNIIQRNTCQVKPNTDNIIKNCVCHPLQLWQRIQKGNKPLSKSKGGGTSKSHN